MDVFISYRRNGGIELATLLKEKLEHDDISVFFDKMNMKKGKDFVEQIKNTISSSANVIVLISEGFFDRCFEEDDIVKKELMEALKQDKNIIPVFYENFKFPTELPVDIENIKYKDGLNGYRPGREEEVYQNIKKNLKTKDGYNLVESKKKNISNVYYDKGVSEEEKQRIIKDRKICKKYEDELLSNLLKDRENVVVFNPAIYEVSSVVEKYSHYDNITKVIGFLSNDVDVSDANNNYSENGKNIFYNCNFESENFIDYVDIIMKKNNIQGFDLLDLTLILKDSMAPFEKLQQLSYKMNPKGIIFIRELDHSLVIGYPDESEMLKKMMACLKHDKFSGAGNMGRKILCYLKRLDIEKCEMLEKIITTANMNTKERSMLFDVYFSYVLPELIDMSRENPHDMQLYDDIEWLKLNYNDFKCKFSSPEFLFISGFVFFYAIMK